MNRRLALMWSLVTVPIAAAQGPLSREIDPNFDVTAADLKNRLDALKHFVPSS